MNELSKVLDDVDVLHGIGYAPLAEQEALLGKIMALPTAQKKVALTKLVAPKNVNDTNLSARGQVMTRIGALPDDIRKGLIEKRLQISDSQLYFVKVANAVTSVRMITNNDSKAPGVTNVVQGRLDKDNYFLVTGIILLSGVAADPLNAAFDTIALAIANGDFEFKGSGNKYLLPKDHSCQIFDTNNRTDIQNGMYVLSTPKWLEPQQDITFNINFSQATAANTNLKLVLVGAQIINY